jgi:N-acetylglucosaminyldiphosphoundecaprenol N-acetyl-beta-D-mannosaminyltransferase
MVAVRTRAGVVSPTLRLGLVTLDVVDQASAVELLLGEARREQSCVVVTPNIHHLRLARIDPAFQLVLDRAEYVLADGWPLIVASRLLRPSLPGRIAGIDLVDDILTADGPRLRVALLGGPPGAAGRFANRISESHSVVYVNELRLGAWDTPEGIRAISDAIGAACPNLTLIGIGAPRQELLADSLRRRVCGPIVCCGAAIEVLAGDTPRAPAVLRKTGLEWAFRLIREPRRLGPRYLAAGTSFGGALTTEIWGRLFGRHQ